MHGRERERALVPLPHFWPNQAEKYEAKMLCLAGGVHFKVFVRVGDGDISARWLLRRACVRNRGGDGELR